MLTFQKFWHGAVYVVAAMLVISSVAIQLATQGSVGAVTGNCGPNTLFIAPDPGEVLTEKRMIELKVDPPTGSTLSEVGAVRFFAGSSLIGNASLSAANTWRYEWDTKNFSNGQKQLTARVFSSGNVICTAGPVQVTVDNPTNVGTSGNLELLRKSPSDRDVFMITNFSRVFEVRAIYDDGTNVKDVTTAANYSWLLDGKSVGTIPPGGSTQPSIQYKSGPDPGIARLIVTAQYLDQTTNLVYDIFIAAAEDSTYPESSADEVEKTINSSDDATEALSSEDTKITSESSTTLREREASNPELKACLIEVLGESEYKKLVSGERRLAYRELTRVDRCFASTNFVLPANIAPVEPERVADLTPNTRLAKVATAEQVTRDSGSEAILLSGTSTPNSAIVIYIFSEPLVLTTKTDGEGNWTYILEDPLAPGEHKVYVTVESENEIVRSEPFAFSVEQAASLETNPTGLSLTLGFADPQQSSMIVYVSGVVAVVLVGVGLYVFAIRRKGDFVDIDETEDPITKIKT